MQVATREAWLNAVAAALSPRFGALGAPLTDHIRIAIGFTSRGIRGRAIGECWDNRHSEDGVVEESTRKRTLSAASTAQRPQADLRRVLKGWLAAPNSGER